MHAGWRGVAARIAPRALERLRDGRDQPALAVLGPHIRRAHFEVGEEVVDQLRAATPGIDHAIDRSRAKPHVDMAAILRAQLEPLGVDVHDVGGDTFADATRFFSYRRDAGNTGRHLAVVVA